MRWPTASSGSSIRATVGHPFNTEALVVDDDGKELPAGEVGEVYLRWVGQTETSFEYSGQVKAKRNAEGFSSLGDLGWLDDDGFLFGGPAHRT